MTNSSAEIGPYKRQAEAASAKNYQRLNFVAHSRSKLPRVGFKQHPPPPKKNESEGGQYFRIPLALCMGYKTQEE